MLFRSKDDDPPFDPDPEPVKPAEPVKAAAPVRESRPEPVVSDGLGSADTVDSLDEELFSFDDEKPKPRQLTLMLRVQPNAPVGSSERRVKRLIGIVSSYPGRDRFSLMIMENGKVYLVDYPDVHTNICDDMMNRLTEILGEDNIQVEDEAPVR